MLTKPFPIRGGECTRCTILPVHRNSLEPSEAEKIFWRAASTCRQHHHTSVCIIQPRVMFVPTSEKYHYFLQNQSATLKWLVTPSRHEVNWEEFVLPGPSVRPRVTVTFHLMTFIKRDTWTWGAYFVISVNFKEPPVEHNWRKQSYCMWLLRKRKCTTTFSVD